MQPINDRFRVRIKSKTHNELYAFCSCILLMMHFAHNTLSSLCVLLFMHFALYAFCVLLIVRFARYASFVLLIMQFTHFPPVKLIPAHTDSKSAAIEGFIMKRLLLPKKHHFESSLPILTPPFIATLTPMASHTLLATFFPRYTSPHTDSKSAEIAG